MGNLVFIQNGQVLTDSLTVAECFGKEHRNVLADIRNQLDKLAEAGEHEFSLLNFQQSTYKNERGREYERYLLTEEGFTLVAFSYTTPEAMKMKVKFIQEFKRMKEALQNQPRILNDREKLIASMKLSLETAEEVNAIKDKVAQLEQKVDNQITIDLYQQQALQHQINKRVKDIYPEYKSQMTEKKMFAQIHSHLRRAFTVPSYKVVRKKHFEEAMQWVKSWRPLV
jgi:Rha family phage regulatory protein